MRQAQLLSALCALQRGNDEGLTRHFVGLFRLCQLGILIHHAHDQILIQAAPIDTDTYWLVILFGHPDHHGELVFTFTVLAHVAGVDTVFGQRLCTLRIFSEQSMSVVMKIADEWHVAPHVVQHPADDWHLNGCLGRIHCDAHQFGASLRQLVHLLCRTGCISRICVGHGLDDDGRIATDMDIADTY